MFTLPLPPHPPPPSLCASMIVRLPDLCFMGFWTIFRDKSRFLMQTRSRPPCLIFFPNFLSFYLIFAFSSAVTSLLLLNVGYEQALDDGGGRRVGEVVVGQEKLLQVLQDLGVQVPPANVAVTWTRFKNAFARPRTVNILISKFKNSYFSKLNIFHRQIYIIKGNVPGDCWDVRQCFVRQLFGFKSTIQEFWAVFSTCHW